MRHRTYTINASTYVLFPHAYYTCTAIRGTRIRTEKLGKKKWGIGWLSVSGGYIGVGAGVAVVVTGKCTRHVIFEFIEGGSSRLMYLLGIFI